MQIIICSIWIGFLEFDGIIAMVLCVIDRKVESNVRVLGWLKEKKGKPKRKHIP